MPSANSAQGLVVYNADSAFFYLRPGWFRFGRGSRFPAVLEPASGATLRLGGGRSSQGALGVVCLAWLRGRACSVNHSRLLAGCAR